MFTLLLVLFLIALIIVVYYVSTYLYENDIRLVALGVVIIGLALSIFIVGMIMDNMVEYISHKLDFFYNKDN